MSDVIILGAGMVGVSTALALQARGRGVIVIDRRAPGRETSYGNAGLIQTEAAIPHGMPRKFARLWAMALRRDNSTNWHVDALPSNARLLWQYWYHSQPRRHYEIARTWSALTAQAVTRHAPLIDAAGAGHLVREEGFRQAYTKPAQFEAEQREAEAIHKDYGRNFRVLTGDELAAAEPALRKRYIGAIQWTDPWSCRNPGALTAAYGALFAQRGGTIEEAEVTDFAPSGAGWTVTAGGRRFEAADLVIAAGPWAKPLLAPLGYPVAMFSKRGYHRHYTGGDRLNMPMGDADMQAFLAPMEQGMRLLTGAEIARAGAPGTPVQLLRAEAVARTILDLGDPVEADPWFGNRPCFPDMLPVVGRASRHRGLWFHFGHCHQGFTLGPTTAEILADDMTGGPAAPPALQPARVKL